MSNVLSRLTASERARLLEELNYMNLEEFAASARGAESLTRSWRSPRTAP